MRRFFSQAFRSVCAFAQIRKADAGDAPLDRVQLGLHAQRLLDDSVLELAFSRVERDLVEAWRNTAIGEAAAREAAYAMIFGLAQVKAKLRSIAGDAKVMIAEQLRREEQERREAARRERHA